MHRRWADAEVELHVGFGRRPAMQQRIGVDERQILALLGRESFCRRTHAGHPIQLFVRASNQGGADECALPGGVSHAERTELRSLLSGGKQVFFFMEWGPRYGVIFIQSGPRRVGSTLASRILGGRDWNAGCGDDRQDTPGVLFPW